jgi:hypothetical protein
MNRLVLYVNSEGNPEDILSSKRNYQHLKLSRGDYDANSHNQIFEKFGKTTTKLEFESCEINLEQIKFILDCCPNIEELIVNYVRSFEENDQTYSQLPKLNHLKKLDYIESYLEVFKLLKGVQLDELLVRFVEDVYTNFEHFVDFFQLQESLRTFKLEQVKDTSLFAVDFSKDFKSQLKKFEMVNCGFDIFDKTVENVTKFLKGQTKLEEVVLKENDFLTDADYEHILTKNPNLKSLTVDVRYYQGKGYECLSVRDLHLTIGEGNPNEEEEPVTNLNSIITQFPAVESLQISELPNLDRNTYQSIANTMSNLRELTLEEPQNECLENLTFPSLLNLKLLRTWHLTDQGFESFFKNNRKITKLIINYANNLKDSSMKIIVENLKDLEELEIYGMNELSKKSFDLIGANLLKLKIFRLKTWCQKFNSQDMEPLKNIQGLKVYAVPY